MKAASVARTINLLFGYKATRVEEGDDQVDGLVELNEAVSIQVPLTGKGLQVSRFDGDVMHHFPIRPNTLALKDDLAAALADAKAAGPIPVRIITFDIFRNGEFIKSIEALSHSDAMVAVDSEFSPNTCMIIHSKASEHDREHIAFLSSQLASRSASAEKKGCPE